MAHAITVDQIHQYQQALAATPSGAALARAVQTAGPQAASQAPLHGPKMTPVFSVELATGAVTNQRQSGRCWLFADLNTHRHLTNAAFKLKDFEFSQAYNAFFDRLEKSNHFLEEIIATADRPLDDRTVAALLAAPNGDGGQFDNAQALLAKYGAVPQSVMPETYHSSKTADLNATLALKLRQAAAELRTAAAAGESATALDARKHTQLSAIYRILAYAYGNPPTTFDFAYRDTDNQYHLDRGLTPQTFYAKYIGGGVDDYAVLIHYEESAVPYFQAYTIPAQNHVVGGHDLRLINVPQDVFEQAAIAQLQAGESVWFGNDVLADMDRTSGTLQAGLYDYGQLFGVDLQMSQAERFETRQAHTSHAMVLTGVDLVDGAPRRWKVENSWGKDNGNDGYFTADAAWFKAYAYHVAIRRDLLPASVQAALTQTPVALPAWSELG